MSTDADGGPGAEPPAVLFVDDEEVVLAGLRTSLRRLRRRYRFHFAVGAQDAIELLEREPIAVVVTDVRMPGINGVELLRYVKTNHPNVVRYVLSGEAERELVVQAIPVAHRWLSKPCDREVLSEALADAMRYRELIADPAIVAAVAGTDALPTPPTLFAELQDLLADPEVAIGDVADLVGRDPAISVKLLQWANSAFSGGASNSDLRTAIVRIGLATISQMVLLAGVSRSLEPNDLIPGLDGQLLQDHAAATSSIARALAEPSSAATAQVGGLFVNIGLLLEAVHLPDRLAEAYELAASSGTSLVAAERQRFGVAYPDLGGHLLSIWGLPAELVVLVARSHDLPTTDSVAPMTALEAVQAGRLVAQRSQATRFGGPHLDRLDDDLDAAIDRWQQVGASAEGAPA